MLSTTTPSSGVSMDDAAPLQQTERFALNVVANLANQVADLGMKDNADVCIAAVATANGTPIELPSSGSKKVKKKENSRRSQTEIGFFSKTIPVRQEHNHAIRFGGIVPSTISAPTSSRSSWAFFSMSMDTGANANVGGDSSGGNGADSKRDYEDIVDKEVLDAPISDIVVIQTKMNPPPGYYRLHKTPSNKKADVNLSSGGNPLYLCIQKDVTSILSNGVDDRNNGSGAAVVGVSKNTTSTSVDSNNAAASATPPTAPAAAAVPPITNIMVVFPDRNEYAPPGYITVTRSSNIPCNMNTGTSGERVYLCYKRDTHGNPITDLQLIFPGKGEEVPENFNLIDKSISGASANLNSGTGGPEVFLCYRQRMSRLQCLLTEALVVEELAITSRLRMRRSTLKSFDDADASAASVGAGLPIQMSAAMQPIAIHSVAGMDAMASSTGSRTRAQSAVASPLPPPPPPPSSSSSPPSSSASASAMPATGNTSTGDLSLQSRSSRSSGDGVATAATATTTATGGNFATSRERFVSFSNVSDTGSVVMEGGSAGTTGTTGTAGTGTTSQMREGEQQDEEDAVSLPSSQSSVPTTPIPPFPSSSSPLPVDTNNNNKNNNDNATMFSFVEGGDGRVVVVGGGGEVVEVERERSSTGTASVLDDIDAVNTQHQHHPATTSSSAGDDAKSTGAAAAATAGKSRRVSVAPELHTFAAMSGSASIDTLDSLPNLAGAAEAAEAAAAGTTATVSGLLQPPPGGQSFDGSLSGVAAAGDLLAAALMVEAEEEDEQYRAEMAYLLAQVQQRTRQEVVDAYGLVPPTAHRRALLALLSALYIRHGTVASEALQGLRQLIRNTDFFEKDLERLPAASSTTMVDLAIEAVCDRFELSAAYSKDREALLDFLTHVIPHCGAQLSLQSLQRLYRSLSYLCCHHAITQPAGMLEANLGSFSLDADIFDDGGGGSGAHPGAHSDAAFQALNHLLAETLRKVESAPVAMALPAGTADLSDINSTSTSDKLMMRGGGGGGAGESAKSDVSSTQDDASSIVSQATYELQMEDNDEDDNGAGGRAATTAAAAAGEGELERDATVPHLCAASPSPSISPLPAHTTPVVLVQSILNELVADVLDCVEISRLNAVTLATIAKQTHSTVMDSFWRQLTALGNTLFEEHSYRSAFLLLGAVCKQCWHTVRTKPTSSAGSGSGGAAGSGDAQPLTQDVNTKLVALGLLEQFCLLSGETMQQSKVLGYTVRRIVIPCLLYNVSFAFLDHRIFAKLLKIMTAVWKKWRRHVRIEFAILCEQFVFKVMQSSVVQVRPIYKMIMIQEVAKWFDQPEMLLEMFVNYDMDRKFVSTWNTFGYLVRTLCSIGRRLMFSLGSNNNSINSQNSNNTGAGAGGGVSGEHGQVAGAKAGEDDEDEEPGGRGGNVPAVSVRDVHMQALAEVAVIAKTLMDASGHAYLIQQDTGFRNKSLGTAGGWIEDESDAAAAAADGDGGNDDVATTTCTTTTAAATATGGIADDAPSSLASSPESVPPNSRHDTTGTSNSNNHSNNNDNNNNNNNNNNTATSGGGRRRVGSVKMRRQAHQESEALIQEAVKIYHAKDLKKAVKFLISREFMADTPQEIANFLRMYKNSFDPGAIGEFLGAGGKNPQEEEYWSQIRFRYTRAVSFVEMDVEPALRLYLTGCGFRLPGEAQVINRFVEAFVEAFWQDNAGTVNCPFKHPDTVHLTTYAIIMLNTDHHRVNADKKKKVNKMNKEQFLNQLRGCDDGQDIDRDYLVRIFDNVEATAIELEVSTPSGSAQKAADQSRAQSEQQLRLYSTKGVSRKQRAVEEAKFVKELGRTLRDSEDLLRSLSLFHYRFSITNIDTKISLDLVSFMYESVWFHFHAIAGSLLNTATMANSSSNSSSASYSEVESFVKNKALDILIYSLTSAVFLDLKVERMALASLLKEFRTQLEELPHIHANNNNAGDGLLPKNQKKIPDNSWYDDVENAFPTAALETISKLHHLNVYIKDLIQETISYETTRAVAEQFEKKAKIMEHNLYFVRQGDLEKISSSGKGTVYRFFLFSDHLIYTHKRSGQWVVHESLPLTSLEVGGDVPSDSSQCSLYIEHPIKSFIAVAESPTSKQAWVRDIAQTIFACRKRQQVALMEASVAATGNTTAAVRHMSIVGRIEQSAAAALSAQAQQQQLQSAPSQDDATADGAAALVGGSEGDGGEKSLTTTASTATTASTPPPPPPFSSAASALLSRVNDDDDDDDDDDDHDKGGTSNTPPPTSAHAGANATSSSGGGNLTSSLHAEAARK